MGYSLKSLNSFMLIVALLTLVSYSVPTQALDEPDEQWVEETLENLTLKQKAGQVLCKAIRYDQKADGGWGHRNLISSARDLGAGAFHISGGDSDDVVQLINSLQEVAEIPLVFTADMEGGLGSALRDATFFPRAMALASTGDIELVRMCAKAAGEEGKAVGIGINYYPVLDVNTDPGNNIINYRAFSDNPETVSTHGIAYMEGIQSAGLLATGKHFPGHGHTSIDSHTGRVVIGLGESEFRRTHLTPFRQSVGAGIDAIMTGHIIVPSLGESHFPATLSERLTTGVLKTELNFDGLVITDAMSMGAIMNYFSQEEAAVMSLAAGADLIIFPPDPNKYSQAIQNAITDGTLSEDRLNDAVRKVLRAKSRLGLQDNRFVDPENVSSVLKNDEHVRLSNRAAAESIVLYRDSLNRLPIDLSELSVTLLQVGDLGIPPYTSRGQALTTELEKRCKSLETFHIGGTPVDDDYAAIAKASGTSDLLLCSTIVTVTASKNRIDLTDMQKDLIDALRPFQEKAILLVFGSPYSAASFPWFDTVVIGCDTLWEMQRAAIRSIEGENEFKGKLPVLLDRYKSKVEEFHLYR